MVRSRRKIPCNRATALIMVKPKWLAFRSYKLGCSRCGEGFKLGETVVRIARGFGRQPQVRRSNVRHLRCYIDAHGKPMLDIPESDKGPIGQLRVRLRNRGQGNYSILPGKGRLVRIG